MPPRDASRRDLSSVEVPLQSSRIWVWHYLHAMLGCSTVCPKCQHQFSCCTPVPCCTVRRSLHGLSGGGLVSPAVTPTSPCLSPQVSPSAPLAFVIPPCAPLAPAPPLADTKPEIELNRLADTVQALRQSGWYYEGISYTESQQMLEKTPVGTFLVRESSDPRFLFSLSVQTERGPTSVRIHYVSGYFRLDSQPNLQATMPIFPSVIELIQYYVLQSRASQNSAQVWVDPKGKLYSTILLDKPLKKEDKPPSLKHLARVSVHKALQNSNTPKLSLLPPAYTQLDLPASVISYLAEYPFFL